MLLGIGLLLTERVAGGGLLVHSCQQVHLELNHSFLAVF